MPLLCSCPNGKGKNGWTNFANGNVCARLLSDVKITDSSTLRQAIEVLHTRYRIPHVVITSVSLPLSESPTTTPTPDGQRTMSVVGSTRTATGAPRLFMIRFPVFDGYFSGTGDMFAALMVARMREAVHKDPDASLRTTESWLSADAVEATALPLAHAAETVLASMHELLSRTSDGMTAEVERATAALDIEARSQGWADEEKTKRLHLLKSRAAELKLVRNLGCLRAPKVEYRAEKMV